MNREYADKITTGFVKPIYGFALKRCRSIQDAEDLAQEICLKLYRALLAREDFEDVQKYVWTVAHNAMANYYRDRQGTIGVPMDEVEDFLVSEENISGEIIKGEAAAKLHAEIAYLSKMQRRIVIDYYFRNKKQEAIAKDLDIPLGTVKWHLFESKKELKEGIQTMRQASELKFNPIKFSMCGFSGSTGKKGGPLNFFRSSLSQNIVYSVRRSAKIVNEIAEELGVSPVYVESEAEFLEKYGFLIKRNDKYLINILLDETDGEIIKIKDEMYDRAAELFANELFDELTGTDILKDERIIAGDKARRDINFMLWTLIPYIAALSGEAMMDKSISFEEAYTVRPDGGKNICYASVEDNDAAAPKYFDSMLKFCGPCWNGLTGKFILWTVDSEWSAKRVTEDYQYIIKRGLYLLDRFFSGDTLSEEEYVHLAQCGYIKIVDGIPSLQILRLKDEEIRKKLLSVGDKIKEKHKAELDALKAPFIKAVLDKTPKHLRKMQMYGLQYIFYSDGWFLLHCLKALIDNGNLKLPTEEQKKSLTTIIVPNK